MRIRQDVAILRLGTAGLRSKKNNLGRRFLRRLEGSSNIGHEEIFLEDKVVGREDRYDCIRMLFLDMHQGKQNAWAGFSVSRLDYKRVRSPAGDLLSGFWISKMVLCQDGVDAIRGYKRFDTIERVIEQGSCSNKRDILLWKINAAQMADQGPEVFAVAAG